MLTDCVTYFHEVSFDKTWKTYPIVVYRSADGYLDRHGRDLVEFSEWMSKLRVDLRNWFQAGQVVVQLATFLAMKERERITNHSSLPNPVNELDFETISVTLTKKSQEMYNIYIEYDKILRITWINREGNEIELGEKT